MRLRLPMPAMVAGLLLVLSCLAGCSSAPDEDAAIRRISQYEDIAGVARADNFRLSRTEAIGDKRYLLYFAYEVRAESDFEAAVLKLAKLIDASPERYYPPQLHGKLDQLLQGTAAALLAPARLPQGFSQYLQADSHSSYQDKLASLQLALYAARAYGFRPDTERGELLQERNMRVPFYRSASRGWLPVYR
ncbi:hypothetical protein [Vogesella oryzae]|uniref:hypothetical protein n=1 Tax=Vogesella oryzae TaxID=1735285 RepID=UPI0015834F31|nr:hypothetical protein [Vogesella oryzae]